jgi:hypothetical protein
VGGGKNSPRTGLVTLLQAILRRCVQCREATAFCRKKARLRTLELEILTVDIVDDMDDYISKPAQIGDIQTALERWDKRVKLG